MLGSVDCKLVMLVIAFLIDNEESRIRTYLILYSSCQRNDLFFLFFMASISRLIDKDFLIIIEPVIYR